VWKRAYWRIQVKLVQYTNARNAANAMYDHFKIGNYITVIHEPGDVPAAMFASINENLMYSFGNDT